MPIDSATIAQLNGGYQALAMNNLQYANMIGQGGHVYGGGTAGFGGDAFAGGLMNRAAAMQPIGSTALMLAGLDPMGLGLRAGAAAYGTMGLGGAAAVGGAVMLPAMAGYAAAGYTGNQMYTGAQQQFGMNNMMRGSFSFRNAYGGQGFTRSDMTQFGNVLRDMSHQFGPGGEIASFGELSQIASKMGQMGFAQGIRDIQQFSKTFKEMVSALKTMARDLGTTLEGAMEFAGAARGSGIFGMRNIQNFTGAVRAAAVSGGMAISEVTGAANVGSQISRSIGGLGRHGAVAGIRTIGQIGTAQQLGALSEEDIYNVTGMTGAEGRQAYATSLMSRSAGFLRSGRGRRLVAALAGNNGELDESALQTFMSGGMDIEETIKQGERMKRDVGRWNFVRNEGRLRGAVLGRVGGLVQTAAYKQWIESKGYDVDDMSEKGMLAFQRFTGMGRDEADNTVKLLQNLPGIAQKQQFDKENDQYFQQVGQDLKMRGIEGARTRLDQAREEVNSHLQKLGQDIFNEASDSIERFLNKLSDNYVRVSTERADAAVRNLRHGRSASAEREFQMYLGRGVGHLATGQSLGGRTRGAMTLEEFQSGGGGGAFDLGTILHGKSMDTRYREAGYGREADLFRYGGMNQAGAIAAGARTTDAGMISMGASAKGLVQDIYTGGAAGKRGSDRITAVMSALADRKASGDGHAAVILANLEKAGPERQAAIIASLEKGAGISDDARFARMSAVPNSLRGESWKTEDQRNEAYANAAFGETREATFGRTAGAVVGGVLGSAVSIAGTALGALAGGVVGSLFDRNATLEERNRKAGAASILQSEQGVKEIYSLFSSGKEEKERMRSRLETELQSLQASGEEKSARALFVATSLAASEYSEAGGEGASEDAIGRISKKYAGYGVRGGREGLRATLGGIGDVDENRRRNIREEEARRIRDRSKGILERDAAVGFGASSFTVDSSGAYRLQGVEGVSAAGREYLESTYKYNQIGAGMTGDDFGGYIGTGLASAGALARMSVKEKRALAQRYGGSSFAGELTASASTHERLQKLVGKKGFAAAAAGGLGVSLQSMGFSESDLTKVGGAERLQGLLADRLGLEGGSSELRADIGAYTSMLRMRDFGGAAQKLQNIMGSKEVQDRRTQDTRKAAEEKDPLMVDVVKNTGRMAEALDNFMHGKKRINVYVENMKDQSGSVEDRRAPGAPQPGAPVR